MKNDINKQLEKVNNITDMSKLNLDELLFILLKGAYNWNISDEYNMLTRLSELWEEETKVETKSDCYLTIDQLKKQIKYSRNQLEVKMLNKKLNQMYKDMKRSKNGC